MTTRYEPASDFLKAVVADDIPLSGSPFADANMRRLIALTQDDDLSNRDWATMLLAQDDADTWEVRQALLVAVADPDAAVRAEALAGLAWRDPSVALPLVIAALSGDCVSAPVFEAAATIAAPSLVDLLRPWTEPSDNAYLDDLARQALAACQAGAPVIARE
jgi:hypothetical protein